MGAITEDLFLFTGRQYHYINGIYDYRHRFYHPGLGRFLERDPIGIWGDGANAGNAYEYVGSDAINGIDPWGLYDTDVHYYLTKFLCLKTCIPEDKCETIAQCDQGTDEWQGTDSGGLSLGENAVLRRKRFHFPYVPRSFFGGLPREDLYDAAKEHCNWCVFGIYLHVLQDAFAHEGYGPKYGHSEDGHAPDYTKTDPDRADKMVKKTLEQLCRFAKETGCCETCDPGATLLWVADEVKKFIGVEGGDGSLARKAEALGMTADRDLSRRPVLAPSGTGLVMP
jgi:RHS repeat-associated protein